MGAPTLLGTLEGANLVIPWLELALSNGPNRVGVAIISSDNGNRSSYRNVAFFRTPDDE
jgi:hypothetical protein